MNDLIVFDSESIPKKNQKKLYPEHELETFHATNVWDPVWHVSFLKNHPYVSVGWGHQLRHLPGSMGASSPTAAGAVDDFVWVEQIQSFFLGNKGQQRNNTYSFSFKGKHIF